MTIPAAADWCPACEETCQDHASICTVCGTTLTPPPGRQRQEESSNQRSTRIFPTVAEVLPELRQANRDMQDMIQRIRQQRDATGQDQAWQNFIQQQQAQDQEEWQRAPAEWLDPSAGTAGGIRPTSKQYLETLPRTVLQKYSSILWQPLMAFQASSQQHGGGHAAWTVEGTVGDFGIPLPSIPFQVQGQVVLATPRNGRGGVLSADCRQRIQDATLPVLLYFDRGDTTFVQKALLAQSTGATACLIGNHVAEPWPYMMKDSKGEAKAGLRIPTVLLPKQAAMKLKGMMAADSEETTTVRAHLDICQSSRSDSCVVCTETFVPGVTVVRLPECGHLFHESCAMPWLQKHNTCMYCRRELPTDDAEYERERRRTHRTHAGSAAQQSTEFHNFYG